MTVRIRPAKTDIEDKYERAADGLDRANRFLAMAEKAMVDADDGEAFDQAQRELARAKAGVRYAALVLRCQATPGETA